uniref:Methyltransferase domain-containing protein n=1 Tax=Candidatus Kentrum sp. UNK TaxID=2126344 RepID=A0A451ANN9_9GAMM|nr:MAG: Methyltransferase domain-containing protein [Candidatus Kentron sp. UNK]VFK72917.1 MAG: Methyltransferase domain-containing protein [Candidatus Kentron sp. UNK]
MFDSQKTPTDTPKGDVSALMRVGHPQVEEGDLIIIELVKRFVAEFGRRPRILDIGCGTGFFASRLLKAIPEMDLIVQENWAAAIDGLERRFADTPARIFTGAASDWDEPVDMVISWGTHHHQPRTYLDHIRRFLDPKGLLILGDEFCPEYCFGEHAERIRNASRIYIANGYLLTSDDEIAAYEKDGTLPDIAREIEKLRLRMLWRWYRYVVDYAMERDCLEVAVFELRAARDDLKTDSADEFKLSPLAVEKEVESKGFKKRARHPTAPNEPLEKQSFFIYEYGK